MPLGCLNPLIVIGIWDVAEGLTTDFVCNATIILYDLSLGIPFFELDRLEIGFWPGQKAVFSTWELLVADVFCIEPWFGIGRGNLATTPEPAVSASAPIFDGLELLGLSLELAYNGVTFKAGTAFGDAFDRYGNRHAGRYPWLYCEPWRCEVMEDYDEYYGLIIDGDSCCGGGFGLSIFVWFDAYDVGDKDTAGIFGWEETRFEGYVDIGTNATLTGSLSILNEGLNWIQVGMEFVF